MEKERLAREKEEQEKAERARKLKEEFGDPNNQWEQDKTDMKKLAQQDDRKAADGGAGAAKVGQGQQQ